MMSSYVFLLSGLLFLVLAAMLAASWRDEQFPRRLLWACLASAAWSVAYAIWYPTSAGFPPILYLADIGRAVGWILLFVSLLVTLGMRRRLAGALTAVLMLFLAAQAAVQLLEAGPWRDLDITLLANVSRMLLAGIGLFVAAQVFLNTPAPGRRSIKYLCIAAGVLFLFDGYASANVLSAPDTSLVLAGAYVHVVVFVLFAVGALRAAAWPGDMQLSHRMVFSTVALVGISLYLLFVAVGSYYIERHGGTWTQAIQVTFLLVALAGLVTLILSDTVRARFRVFVAKHFQRYKYDYRAEWLCFTKRLSEAASEESVSETSVQAMADIVESPGGAMWVISDSGDEYHLMAVSSTRTRPTGAFAVDDPVPEFCRRYGWVIDLHEYRVRPDSYGALVMPEWLLDDHKAWLIVPLLLGDVLVGLVLLDNPAVIPELNFEDRDLLKTVGRAVATHVSQLEASRRLSEHQQFGAYHRFSTFLMHDLKNLIAQLSLVIKNADRHRRNPEFIDDAITTLGLSVDRMNRMIRQFSGGASTARPKQPTRVSLTGVIESVLDRCDMRSPRPRLITTCGDVFIEADAEKLSSALEHILANAQEATPDGGEVRLEVEESGSFVSVRVVDSGCGMSEEFMRTKLFKPFESTKGGSGLGIGAYQAREYIRAIGGEIRVESEVGCGSVFTVQLPLALRDPAAAVMEL